MFCTHAHAATPSARELNVGEITGIVGVVITFLTLLVTILAVVVAIKCCKKWWGKRWKQCCHNKSRGK